MYQHSAVLGPLFRCQELLTACSELQAWHAYARIIGPTGAQMLVLMFLLIEIIQNGDVACEELH